MNLREKKRSHRVVPLLLASLIIAASVSPASVANAAAVPAVRRVEPTPRPIVPRGELGADEKATIRLFETAKSSVVFISTVERVLDVWSRNIMTVPRGTGSGFVWDDEGHIITNLHVIEGAAEANVRLSDGRDYPAALIGTSTTHDIAVLRIRVPSNRPAPIPIGTSHDLQIGQKVFAIGNPFGLDWSLTTGIVSAADRSRPKTMAS